MEPFRKRQRLYSPVRHEYSRNYDDQHHQYYDELAESEDYEELEDDEPISDPDAELKQRRARLDYKLKNTFEAIFEKYGRDFDGVGDEIDLATGDILVNNGHLIDMQNEKDAGDVSTGPHDVEEDTTEPEEDFGSSMMDEEIEDEGDLEEDDAEDEDSQDALSEDDMMEDDIILRGFTQATRFIQPAPILEPSHAPSRPRQEIQRPRISRPSIQSKSLPSREEILSQFGPQLGPEIVQYVSQKKVSERRQVEPAWSVPDILPVASRQRISNIEPAWRVPELPVSAPRKRPLLKTVILQPEVERSPSPETAPSLWAPIGKRRRRRRRTNPPLEEDHSMGVMGSYPSYHASNAAVLFGDQSIAGFDMNQMPRQKKRRIAFTAEDDRIMLDAVARARKHDFILPASFWEELAAQYPHHPAGSWKQRYFTKFTYMESNMVDDSEVSATETSEDADQFITRRESRPNLVEKTEAKPAQVSSYQRPVRERKPAQRDSRILSWSEAVNTIKSLDPELHAGMRDDAKLNLDEGSWAFDHRGPSSGQQAYHRRVSDNVQTSRPNYSDQSNSQLLQQPRRRFSDLPISTSNKKSRTMDITRSHHSDDEDDSITSAPCPHVDCRPYTTKFYKLQRMADEEQSQMSLHLLSVHQTTPFPCGEAGCPHKGEHGYFMQTELVRHVRSAHPNKGALNRLRGRVDQYLLGKSNEPLRFSSNTPNPPNQPSSRHRDSDFMHLQRPSSNRITSSTRPFSRSSDLDHTLTPRGTTAASTHTPMTSVSSLMVNHPSAKVSSVAGMDSSRERSSMPGAYMHGNNTGSDNPPKPRDYYSVVIESNEDEQQTQWHNEVSPDLGATGRDGSERLSSASHALLDVQANGGQSFVGAYLSSDDEVMELIHGRHHRELVSPPITQNSSPRLRQSLQASIPDSQSSLGERPSSSRQPEFTGFTETQARMPPQQNFDQQKVNGLGSQPTASYLMPPPSKPGKPIGQLQPATPPKKRKPRKPATSNIFDMDDADELSLGSEGFVLLSARAKATKTPLELPVHIKREGTVDIPEVRPSTATRKRKLQDFQEDDDLDELMVDGPDFSVSKMGRSSKAPKIKAEELAAQAITAPSLQKPATPKRPVGRPRKSTLPKSVLADFPSVQVGPSTTTIEFVRTDTPLLDLTPNNTRSRASRQVEIAASDQDSSSPLAGIETPIRNKHLAGAEGPVIVIKTPGGTFRRCGEDGFACKKSFCFRCGSSAASSKD